MLRVLLWVEYVLVGMERGIVIWMVRLAYEDVAFRGGVMRSTTQSEIS